MGQYTVNLPTPKNNPGKATVTKKGGQTFISYEGFYNTKEGKQAAKELQKFFKQTAPTSSKIFKK